MCAICSCALGLCSGTAALAQPPSIDPPLVGRPHGFSNIVGKYDIQIDAEPTEVCVEEPITLHIRIVGAGPAKYEPDRKYLDLFPNWDDDFYVQEMRDEHRVDRDQKTWHFVYRLRPKHAKVSAIDGIKLIYYDPTIASKNKFVMDPAKPIEIKVKPKPPDPGPKIDPPAVPDSFYEHAASSDVLVRFSPPIEVPREMMFALLLGGLFGCLLVFAALGSQTGNDRRNDAARRALAELRSGNESPWSIVCRYLRERLNFAAQDATPREVARFLKRRGFALERCAQSEAFLQKCDAVQFTGTATIEVKSLAAEAAALIQTLEADPCVR